MGSEETRERESAGALGKGVQGNPPTMGLPRSLNGSWGVGDEMGDRGLYYGNGRLKLRIRATGGRR